MADWIDTTSYSRDERGKVDPRAWTLSTGQTRPYERGAIHVEIHGLHGMPGAWFVTCHDLAIEKRNLETMDVDVAKDRALRIVRTRLKSLGSALDRAAPIRRTEKVENRCAAGHVIHPGCKSCDHGCGGT